MYNKYFKFIFVFLNVAMMNVSHANSNDVVFYDYMGKQSEISESIKEALISDIDEIGSNVFFVSSSTDFNSMKSSDIREYDTIVITGERDKNMLVMKHILGYGIQRDIILIKNAHSKENREVSTISCNDCTSEKSLEYVFDIITNKR